MKKMWITFSVQFLVGFCFSQLPLDNFLKFNPTFGGAPLVLNNIYSLKEDSISITELRFYISNIALLQNGNEVLSLKNKYFLLDVEAQMQISLGDMLPEAVEAVRFVVGVDSLANVSGAMGGDLDPLHGMYWTWQSGYINFKLAGTSIKCKTRNQAFQFHIGGYAHPYATVQTITLPIDRKNLEIDVNIAQLLAQVDLSETHTIMSPGVKAVQLSTTYQEIFTAH